MAALDFPASPVDGQTYTANGAVWTYNLAKTRWYVTNFTNAPTGPIGYTGSRGVIGYTGSQGVVGFTGSQGYTGSKGDIGFTGSQGVIGFTGSQGVIGYTGSKGDIGFTGSVGSIANGPRLRLTSNTAGTLSSTLHAFQIDSDAATNIVGDPDGFQVRTAGVADTIRLNPFGGAVILGGAATPNRVFAYGPLQLEARNLQALSDGDIMFNVDDGCLLFEATATNDRSVIQSDYVYRLTANGTAFGPAAGTFFGATSSIPLVANGVYEIEYYCYFLKTTAGTATWSIVNSAVVTNMVIQHTGSAITGSGTTGTWASPLSGVLPNQTAASVALPATGSLTTAANHFVHFKILLVNAASTSIRLNVTQSAGTMTPLRGSYWKARRLASTNIAALSA